MDQSATHVHADPTDIGGDALLADLVARRPAPVERLATIGDVARECGVTLRALRFYEGKGLLKPIREGSTRLYDEEALRRLRIVLRAKRVGFSLIEIRELLEFLSTTNPIPRRLAGTLDRLRRQVDLLELQRREAELSLLALGREIAALEAVVEG